jgi:hypothetical protein
MVRRRRRRSRGMRHRPLPLEALLQAHRRESQYPRSRRNNAAVGTATVLPPLRQSCEASSLATLAMFIRECKQPRTSSLPPLPSSSSVATKVVRGTQKYPGTARRHDTCISREPNAKTDRVFRLEASSTSARTPSAALYVLRALHGGTHTYMHAGMHYPKPRSRIATKRRCVRRCQSSSQQRAPSDNRA